MMPKRIGFGSLPGWVVTAAVCLLVGPLSATADDGPFSAVKAAAERNQAQLEQYSWIATTQVSYDDKVKSTKVESVSYGPDGQQQKNLVSETDAPKPPGLRGRMAERKGEEIKAEIESAVALIHSYVPPNPPQLQAAVAANRMTLSPAPPGLATLVFANYQLPGDALTLTFAVAPKLIQTVNVATWLEDPSKAVTLTVQYQSLPDGTNVPSTTTLTLPSSHLAVTVTNNNYQKLAM
jgi:hypothetical protein